MKRTNIASLGLALLAVLPLTSQAVLAYTAKEVNLRALGRREYPVVATLWPGAALSLEGCLG